MDRGDCTAAILLPTCSNGIGGVSMPMAFLEMMAGIVPAVALAVLKYFDVLSGLDLYYWPVIFVLFY